MTDIHLAVEYQLEGNWHAIETFDRYAWERDDDILTPDDRDYSLFSFLCGVRDHRHIEGADFNVIGGRGLPAQWDYVGLSRALKANDTYHDLLGYHHYTHSTIQELRSLQWPLQLTTGGFYRWLFSTQINDLIRKFGAQNLRVLIGFDS